MSVNHSRLSDRMIRGALSATGGNVRAAAERLSVQRNVLYRRMTQFRIDPKSFRHRHGPGGVAAEDAEEAPAGAGVFGAGPERTEVFAGDTEVPERTQVFAGGTQVPARTQVFGRTEVFAGGPGVHQVHLCSPRAVHAPLNGDTPGRRYSDSSSVTAVESTVADEDRHDDRVNRTVSLPRAEVTMVAQQRRRLSAVLDVDLTDGAMLALFIQEGLVGWVDQKAVAATQPSRPATRNDGRKRRR